MAIPENVAELIADIGWWEAKNEDFAALQERGKDDRCMACNVELGKDTLVTLDAEGICTLFCSSPCLQDFHNVQFLQQVYDEISAGITMRGMGGAADEPEGESDGGQA